MGYTTKFTGRVRSMTPPHIQEKIAALEVQKQKLQKLAAFKTELNQLDERKSALVQEHDALAEELGEARIGARKRSSDEEIQNLRQNILSATSSRPMGMSDIIEMLSSRYEDSTIRNQVKHLLDEGKVKKLGERGMSVMYINAATFNL